MLLRQRYDTLLLFCIGLTIEVAALTCSGVPDNACSHADQDIAAPELGGSLLQRNSQKGSMADDLQDSEGLASHSSTPTTPHSGVKAALREQQQVSGKSLALQIEQRERDYKLLLAQLQSARNDLDQLRAHQAQAQEPVGDNLMQPVGDNLIANYNNNEATQPENKTADEFPAVYVPVPYFMHSRGSGIPSHSRPVSTWSGGLLGDAFEPTEQQEHEDDGKEMAVHAIEGPHDGHHNAHSRGFQSLLFLFGALVIGCLLKMLLGLYLPAIPFTCGLFLVGCVVSILHYLNQVEHPLHWDSWYNSIEMWQGINPHLLFYVFLPALLFGDVVKLKVQLVAVCSGQIMLLAIPGVLFSTALTALFGRYVFPYGWDWSMCFVFGAILSATDPVAVVSLFNTLGVSPKMTMLVSGESLMNDGTAIVCFALALKVALGAKLVLYEAVIFFLQMTVTASVVGVMFGMLALVLLSFCSEDRQADAMIQVVATICCGYLAFFFSESELSSSGVIATVSAGLVLAHSAWPLFVSREVVQTVWEAIEFVGNTVIFFLAGLIFMGTVLEAKSTLGWMDLIWLFALYITCFLIRALMFAVLWLPMNMVGSRIYWREGVAMVWSGLRGAVSVALGMIVDIEPGVDHRIGSQVMFHVGGIAALTLIINAVTIPHVLRALGLAKSETLMNRTSAKLSSRIEKHVRKMFAMQLQNPKDARFYGANSSMVRAMVPILQTDEAHMPQTLFSQHSPHSVLLFGENASNLDIYVQAFREIFLRVVERRYWQGVEDGVTPRHLLVSRVLLHSTEQALDNTWESLSDWDIIAHMLHVNKTTIAQRVLGKLAGIWPFNQIGLFRKASPEFQLQLKIYVALSYIEAHTFTQTEMPPNIGMDDALDVRVQKQVIQESNRQMQKASDLIQSFPGWLVERCKSEMLARRLLKQHLAEVEHMHESGFLTKSEAEHICEPCLHALRDIGRLQQIWPENFNQWAAMRQEQQEQQEANTEVPAAWHAPVPVHLTAHEELVEAPMAGMPRPSIRLANVGAREAPAKQT